MGRLAQDVFGPSTGVSGLACTPVVSSLSVQIGTGSIYSLGLVDPTAYSDIGVDTTDTVLKQGILLAPITLNCPAPVAAGQSINYLIEAQYQDTDTGNAVLPYYNAANPPSPLSGPGGFGSPQPTQRDGIISLIAKAGASATTGTQITPTPDAGYVGVWVVTVAFGQTSIVTGNISKAIGAPFIGLATQSQSGNYAPDIGSVNAYAVSLSPSLTAHVVGMPIRWKAASTNTATSTFNDGAGFASMVLSSGNALLPGMIVSGSIYTSTWTGSAFQVDGSAFLLQPTEQTISLTAGQTALALSGTPLSLASTQLNIDGSTLTPGVDFTLSGSTITLTTGATLGQTAVIYFTVASFVFVPAPGTVNDAALASGSVVYQINQAYQRTAAEIAASVNPTNLGYAPWRGEDVRRFGAAANGTTNDRGALFTANSIGSSLYFPPGTYKISSNLTFTVPLIFDSGAILKPDAGITVTINSAVNAGPWQIFNTTNSGALITGAIRVPHRFMIEWWGAGQGASDDSAAINACCLAAYTAGVIGIQWQAKTYNITNPVYPSGSSTGVFDSPSWYGMGKRRTTINMSAIQGVQCIGGAGQQNAATIEDMGFTGSAGAVGITFNCKNGMQARRCLFDLLGTGVYFNNGVSGGFTEYCVAVECEWTVNCVAPIAYGVSGGGAASFNGSGVRGGIINGAATAGTNIVTIGTGCLPYNAPFSAQVWFNANNTNVFLNNAGVNQVQFYGNLTVECLGHTGTLATTGIIPYAGTLNVAGELLTGGTFLLCQAVLGATNGTRSTIGYRKSSTQALTTGTNTEASVPALAGTARIVSVTTQATNYDYRYLLWVIPAGSGAGSVTILSTTVFNNAAGYGASTFACTAGGALQVINAAFPGSGVTTYIDSNQMTQNIPPSAFQLNV